MGKKNTKRTQKAIPIMDASFTPPPYETAIGMSNIKEVKRGKKDKYVQLNSCKCTEKKTNNIHRPTRTWESIKELYGDADTTVVWNDQEYKPFFSSKLHKQEDPKGIIEQSEISDVIYPTSNLKNTHEKLSIFDLYRKHKHNKKKRKTGQYFNENSENTDVRFSPYTEPEQKFMSKKKPEKELKDHYDNVVQSDLICRKGPCREAIENLYNLHGLKYTPNRNEKVTKSGNNDNSKKTKTPTKENTIIKNSKNKQFMSMKTTKDENVGYGDQISPDPLNKQDVKDIRLKNSFFGKMLGPTHNNGNTLQTSSDINNDNSKNEKTKTLTKENKMKKKAKNKQAKAINTAKNGNFGNGDQISPVPLNKQDVKDIQIKNSFFGKMLGPTYNNGNTHQTSSEINNDNSKKEETETFTKENKINKKLKNKQAKTINTAKNGNFGNGDQISPVPLNKQDVKDIQLKTSFFGKMLGNTYKNRNTLQTSNDINNDNSKNKETKTLTKENKINKKLKNKQVKTINTAKNGNFGNGDQISPVPLNKQDVKDIQLKNSFFGKLLGNTYSNGNTLQTSSDISNDNSKKEKTKTLTKENKIKKKLKNKQDMAINTAKNGNLGNGDQISPVPLNKQDLKNILRNNSFFGKMIGQAYNNGSTLQTSSDVNNDNSKKEKSKTLTKENKIMKKSKNKQAAQAVKTLKDGNFGYGDKISPITLNNQDLKDIECTCNLIGKMMRHTICKCKNNKGRTLQTSSNVNNSTGDPLLEMKVNLEDMCVINSSEVNEKIKKLGRTEKKNRSCICPSHINAYRVCKRGPCEQALENKHTHFDCKCRKHNIIECNDSTCDLKIPNIKVKSIKKKRPKSPVYTKDNKPLFEVMLDPTNMNIINSDEIQDIVIKASQNKIICPTGICNTMSKDRKTLLNCKCVGKKMTSLVNECEDRTCRKAVKKCKLCYLCSRVFSKSENWTGQEENRKRRPIRANRHGTNIKTDNYIAKSHTHYKRNGVMINFPRSQTPKKGLLGTYVGGRMSEVWFKGFRDGDKKPKKPSVKKKTIKKVKKVSKRRRRRKAFFRKKKVDDRTMTDKFLDCFDKGQENCEKKMKKKTKAYKKNEELAIKENKEMVAAQKQYDSTQQYRWNCLTNFITGALNVSFQTVKIVIKIPFSLLGDPLSSFIYVREKMKDPPAAIIRVFSWFLRTWKNKASCIARSIDESTTLNVVADTLENSTIYNKLMAIKGRTPEEMMMYERKKMVRQRRIQKREDQALYGCQHILLTTMRKTPCLWCYHICPDLYPQCLNFVSFMNNFLHLLLYCGAIMCWTPCIVGFEICRAFMCCLLCTH